MRVKSTKLQKGLNFLKMNSPVRNPGVRHHRLCTTDATHGADNAERKKTRQIALTHFLQEE